METKAALMQMIISFQQQVNLTLLMKMSCKTAQEVCDADGVFISLFLCFSTCIYFYVLRNRDTTMSGLQSDLDTDENDGAVLTAKDGTEWKKIQVSDQSTGRLAGYNILRQYPGSTRYASRNIQAGSLASAWNLFIDKLILEHVQKCTITEASLLVCIREE